MLEASGPVGASSVAAPGTGRWWILAWNKTGPGPWSDGFEFAVAPPAGSAVPRPGTPGAATLLGPSGTLSSSTPTYTWAAVPGAMWYYLWVDDATGPRITEWYTAVQAGCAAGTGTCAVTPSVPLASGPGRWWVNAWNTAGFGPWSSASAFTVP